MDALPHTHLGTVLPAAGSRLPAAFNRTVPLRETQLCWIVTTTGDKFRKINGQLHPHRIAAPLRLDLESVRPIL